MEIGKGKRGGDRAALRRGVRPLISHALTQHIQQRFRLSHGITEGTSMG